RQTCSLAQQIAEAQLCILPSNIAFQSLDSSSRNKIERQKCLSMFLQAVAQSCGMRIDETTLNPTACNDKFALYRACMGSCDNRLHRFTGEAFSKEVAPGNVKTAICGLKRRYID